MKTLKLFGLLIVVVTLSCTKTANSTGGSQNTTTTSTQCTNANLFVTNEINYFNVDTAPSAIYFRYDVSFYKKTNQFSNPTYNSGLVAVNGFTVTSGGATTVNGPIANGTQIWNIVGNSTTGINAGTYTAPTLPLAVKANNLDTIHRSKNYIINHTINDADSIFVWITSTNDQVKLKYSKTNCPSQFVFTPQMLSNANEIVASGNGHPAQTIISIRSINYISINSNGINYLLEGRSQTGYYIPIVNN